MIANALIVSFIVSFIAIAVLGHVLLLAAVWPDLARKWRKRQHDPDSEPGAEPARYSPQPN